MSGNNTTNPLPPGTNSIAIASTSLQSLVIAHTFLVLLVSLLAALFYYSTPHSRCQPIFILNILALVLTFIAILAADAAHIHAILSLQNVWSVQLQLAIGISSMFQLMLVDAILLVRLITVHPLSRIGLVRFALLMSLPITLKITRVVNVALYIYHLSSMTGRSNSFQAVNTAWIALPYAKIEWITQVADNSYASIAFLWTIRSFRPDTTTDELTSTVSCPSFSERIRTLSHLALSNFIIPSLFSIVQLTLLFRIGDSQSNIFKLIDVAFVNAMVSVFGVVFATVWAGKEHRREAKVSLNTLPLEREQWCTQAGWMESGLPSTRQPRDQQGLPER